MSAKYAVLFFVLIGNSYSENLNFYKNENIIISLQNKLNTIKKIYENELIDFDCLTPGRFAFSKKPSQFYYLCTQLPGSVFIKTVYVCPNDAKFDPLKAQCSFEDNFCTHVGRFRKFEDLTCTYYYLCTKIQEDIFIKTEFLCPAGFCFDETQQKCSENYNCPWTSFTTSLMTTFIDNGTSGNNVYQDKLFECVKGTKFENFQDNTCETYFLCSQHHNGNFSLNIHKCPEGSWFHPKLENCSLYYQHSDFRTVQPELLKYFISTVYPQNSIETTEIIDQETQFSVKTTERFLESTTDLIYTEISETTQNSRTGEIVNVTANTENCFSKSTTENSICSSKGRFSNPKNILCTTYFLCSLLQNGSFIQTEYTCPDDSWFDPSLQKCSKFYQCPCAKIITKNSTPGTTVSTFESTKHEPTSSESLTDKSTKVTTFSTTNAQTSTRLSTEKTSTPNFVDYNSTPTVLNCFLKAESEDFLCSSKGRFPDTTDFSCVTYFLCSSMRNGSFVQTKYICPDSSWFDPSLQKCSKLYQCPCADFITTNQTPESTVLMSTSTKDEPTSSHTLTDESTTISISLITSITTDQNSSPVSIGYNSTSTDLNCSTKSENEDFVCSSKGRFSNPKDFLCASYFLCSLLRNGSFVQTEYTCPSGSWFDPSLQKCSQLYQCPCANLITTNTTPATTVTAATELQSSIKLSTEQSILSSSVDYKSTSAISNCSSKAESEDFVCISKGRFSNPNDLSCVTYFLCSLLRNGSFVQTKYTCPKGSWFDPQLQKCNILYHCPCSSTTIEKTTTKPTTSWLTTISTVATTESSIPICFADKSNEKFSCSNKGRFLNPQDTTCTSYFLCSLLRNGSFIQTEYTCPFGSFFNPELQLCSEDYHCPCKNEIFTTVPTTSYKCSSTEEETNFGCTEKGRFINANDPTCSSYFLCSLLRNGSFLVTQYKCPDGSYFDPQLHLCNVEYQCPCFETTTTINLCVPPKLNDFICESKGRFPNKMDVSCRSYFLCNKLRNGTFIQTKYFCPENSYFDPELHICNVNYNCPCQLSI